MSSNTNIGNTPVNQGYVQLIHMGETGGIDGTLRALYDGDGTASDLLIASDKVKISTTLYIGSDTLAEYIQDTVGAMLVTNASHTNLSAAYDDAGDGAIDLTASGDVTLSNTVTLSNKTLAAPTLTGTTQGASITLSGDLTVNGTTTTVNQTNLDVSDNIIGLNRGASSNANDSGLIIERGSTGNNAAIIWDESADKFTLGTTTSTPSATGDLTISTGTLVATIEGNVTGNVTGNADTSTKISSITNSNIVQLTSSQTLTNKTLTSPVIDSVTISTIQTGSESFADNDTSLMTSAAVQDKITSYGYTTNTGDITGVDLTGGTGISIGSETNTTSGAYSSTISLSHLGLEDLADPNDDRILFWDDSVGDVEWLDIGSNISISGSTISATNTTYASDDFTHDDLIGFVANEHIDWTASSAGTIHASNYTDTVTTIDGTTANGVLTYGGTNNIDTEANLTFDGTDLAIAATGKIYLDGGSDCYIHNPSGDTVDFVAGGRVMLRLFEGGTDYVHIDDNVRLGIGSGDDLLIYHNGTDNIIDNSTSDQDLYIKVNDGGSSINALHIDSSAVGHIKLPNDGQVLSIGAGDDLVMQHDGTNTYIDNNKGNLNIGANDADKDLILLCDDGSGGTTPYITLDGSATFTHLYQNTGLAEGKKLFLDGGNDTYITSDSDDLVQFFVGNQEMLRMSEDSTDFVMIPDNVRLSVGTGNDLQLSHNATNSYIQNYTGDLYFQNHTTDGDIHFLVDDGGGNDITALKIDASEVGRVKLPNDLQYLEFGAGGDGIIYSYQDDFWIQNVTQDQDIKFRVNDGGVHTDALFIQGSTTNVGIGTTSPAAPLSVEIPNSGDTSRQEIARWTHSGQNTLSLFAYGGATDLMQFGAWNSEQNISIVTDSSGSISASSTKGIFIKTGGNVGIGTTSPTEKLTVAGAITSTGALADDRTSTAAMDFSSGVTRFVSYGASGTAGIFAFRTAAGGASSAEKVRIDGSGNVGIGETSPASDLVVRTDTSGGRGGEITILNYAANAVGNEAALNFGLEASTYNADNGNAQIKARVMNGSNAATDMIFSTWNGSAFGERARIDSSGNVGIGTQSPSNKFTVNSTAANQASIQYDASTRLRISVAGSGVATFTTDNNAACAFTKDVVAYATSDKRLKDNIKPLDNALDKINKINGVEFDWNDTRDEDGKPLHSYKGHDVGVIAQEIEEVLPEVVTTRDNGYKAVKYEKIVPLLIEAIKEQQEEIDLLKANYDQLKYNRR